MGGTEAGRASDASARPAAPSLQEQLTVALGRLNDLEHRLYVLEKERQVKIDG
jgi:hypothetical protein